MSEATFDKLAALAAAMSTPERKVSPMQVAAQLLEEAVGRARTEAGYVPQLADAEQAQQAGTVDRANGASDRNAVDDQGHRPLADAKDQGGALERRVAPNRKGRREKHEGRERKKQR
jgi:hypothetical protein